MLTLNQTPGNNNQTLWCLRLRGEGNNLISNSTFGSATGWTLTGDWAIASGVAIYTYSANASGDLQMTLPAATGVPYILEYEVTAVAGTGYNLYLRGGASGTLFNATQIGLDLTLGKHSVRFTGDSGGGTIFRIGASGFGASDSISIDNVKVRKIENIIYLSTRDITLTNAYDGQALNFDSSLTEISSPSTIQQGGGTGEVSTYSFNISRYVSNAGFNSFFNELYPASEGGFIVSRLVDIGVCWVGATADTQITWLMRGRVIDYNYQQRILSLTVFQESEISNKEVPYYAVQKHYNNDISYFPSAPDENFGVTIPVVYGTTPSETTSLVQLNYSNRVYYPIILVNKSNLQFLGASHKVYEYDNSTIEIGQTPNLYSGHFIFTYNTQINNYIGYLCDATTITNYQSLIISFASSSDTITRYAQTQMSYIGTIGSITEAGEVVNYNSDDYIEIDGGDYIVLRRDISSVDTMFKSFYRGYGATAVQWSADSASARTAVIRNYRPDTGGISESTTINSSTTSPQTNYFRDVTVFDLGLAQLAVTLEIGIRNTSAPGSKIRVYNIWQEWYEVNS